MRCLLAGKVCAVVLLALGGAAAGAQTSDGIGVTIEPAVVDVSLGETVDISVTVTNNTDAVTDELAVHIDITDPSRSGSVDPEDWTETLTRRAGVIQPNTSAMLNWKLQPISGGRFIVYAVVLSPNNTEVHASAGIDFAVGHRRNLNPEGVLPVAVAVPVLIGGALVMQWRRGRRVS